MEGVILKVFSISTTQRGMRGFIGKERRHRKERRHSKEMGEKSMCWIRSSSSGTHVSLLLYLTGSTQQNTSYWGWCPNSLKILVLSCKWAIAAICMPCITWQYIERKTKGALQRLSVILSSVTLKDCSEHWTKWEGHRPSRRIMKAILERTSRQRAVTRSLAPKTRAHRHNR